MSRRRYPLTPALSQRARGWAALVGVVLLASVLALAPVHAQDPVSGALATLAAATVQAQRWQAAQAATRQTSSAQTTATAQVYQAEASATAQAQAVRVTDQAMEATRQVMEIEATRTAGVAQSQATAQAQAAKAAEAAYRQEQAEHERQERVAHYAELFLYAALGLGFVVALLLVWRAYRTLRSVEQSAPIPPPQTPPQAGSQVVIEGEYIPANQRGLNVTVIDDPATVERFEQFVMENGL